MMRLILRIGVLSILVLWLGPAGFANPAPSVTCSLDRRMIYIGSGDAITITASASGFDNDRLTYTWSAEAGHIDGSGAKVHWYVVGATEGTYTVTVHVEDGHGGAATGSVDIVVESPYND